VQVDVLPVLPDSTLSRPAASTRLIQRLAAAATVSLLLGAMCSPFDMSTLTVAWNASASFLRSKVSSQRLGIMHVTGDKIFAAGEALGLPGPLVFSKPFFSKKLWPEKVST
jgi:hypothetical protein